MTLLEIDCDVGFSRQKCILLDNIEFNQKSSFRKHNFEIKDLCNMALVR